MKTIKIQGRSKVVEYQENGEIKRCVLPLDAEDTKFGAPYGLPFQMLLQKANVDERMAQKIERELHNRNVWTIEDLQSNPNAALSAIQAAYSLDVQKLLNLAKRFSQEV